MAGDNRSDAALTDLRVQVVYQFLLQGRPRAWILQNIASSWGLETRQCDNYIRKARTLLRQVAKDKQKNLLYEMLARHAEIRAELMQSKNYGGVLDIDNFDAKLLGLFAPAKLEASGPHGGPIPVKQVDGDLTDKSDEQIRDTLTGLAAAANRLAQYSRSGNIASSASASETDTAGENIPAADA